MESHDARRLFERIASNVESVMHGQHASVRKLLAAFAGGGHVLIEDTPGTGKTTLAKALAASIGASFSRIQFTPDLLPSDILGVSIFNQRESRFEFRAGPVFTSILLADEVNRASPRTQSALLEVMAESQASIEGRTHAMDALFFVVATQNPVEFRGTYPLPEAQMDRFAVRLALGYVSAEEEVGIITAQEREHPLDRIAARVTLEDVRRLKDAVKAVRLAPELKRYAVDLVRASRERPAVQLGAGPRAALALARLAQALALIDGAGFVSPDHIREMAVPVLAHRLVLDPQAKFSGTTARQVVEDVLAGVRAPA